MKVLFLLIIVFMYINLTILVKVLLQIAKGKRCFKKSFQRFLLFIEAFIYKNNEYKQQRMW